MLEKQEKYFQPLDRAAPEFTLQTGGGKIVRLADLRGKDDQDVIAAMLLIADSRFQDELMRAAKDAGKLPKHYEIPAYACDNTPERIERALGPLREQGKLPAFPFGSDFDATELRLIPALQEMQRAAASPLALLDLAWEGTGQTSAEESACLARLGLDGGGFAVGLRIGVVRLDDAGGVEEEFIAATGPELPFAKQAADFRRSPVDIVGVHLDDDRHLVGRVAFEGDMVHDHLVLANPGAFADGPLDDVAGDAFLAGFFDGGKEAGVGGGIGPAHPGGHHDLADNFAGHLRLFHRGDGAFGMQPLTSHGRKVTGGPGNGNARLGRDKE